MSFTESGMDEGDKAPEINRMMITVSIMLATIIQTLDTTIANVALPHMQGSLSASEDQITWVLTSYIVAAAIAMPLTGWMCDRFGVKSVFLASVGGFTFASALCGLSTSMTQIVLARLVQGVFGAALVPLSQATLLDINPVEKQGPAMAVWGMGVMVGPILGPTLGGWLTDHYDWRWVFLVNVPVGLAAFYGIWKYIRYLPGKRSMNFDMFGFATLSLAIGALQMFLDRGSQNDWFSSIETWIEAVVFGMSFMYFILHTRYTPAEKSFFDSRLLKNMNYITGLFFTFVVGLVLYASRALMPTLLQNLMKYPATTAGMIMAPSGVGTMMTMFLAGRLIGRVELRLLLLTGFLITAVALWEMSGYSLDVSAQKIVWAVTIQGIGLGLVFVPLSTASFSTLPMGMRAQGTAIYSLVRNIGSSIGISMVQTLLVRNTQIVHASLAEKITYANPAMKDPLISSLLSPGNSVGLALINGDVTRQAAMVAYINDFWLMMLFTVIVLPLLILIRPPKIRRTLETHSAAMD